MIIHVMNVMEPVMWNQIIDLAIQWPVIAQLLPIEKAAGGKKIVVCDY